MIIKILEDNLSPEEINCFSKLCSETETVSANNLFNPGSLQELHDNMSQANSIQDNVSLYVNKRNNILQINGRLLWVIDSNDYTIFPDKEEMKK